jgi:hypothetical protein
MNDRRRARGIRHAPEAAGRVVVFALLSLLCARTAPAQGAVDTPFPGSIAAPADRKSADEPRSDELIDSCGASTDGQEPAVAGEAPAPSREFATRPLITRGYVRGSGTYFEENTSSPLDPIAGLGSRGLARIVGNLKPEYKPFGDRKLTIAANAFGIASKGNSNAGEFSSFDFFLLESYADLETGAYRLTVGKRNTVRSVGYFRYPLDFYDTPSLVTTGAEDPRRVLETRNGPLLASLERRWSGGNASVEYLPKLPANRYFDWHSNEQQQIIGRYGFVRGSAAVNVAIQRVLDREQGSDAAGRPLRSRDVTETGASTTYVVGSALELHAEASFRRDQRLPSTAAQDFQFPPLPVAVPLPVWNAGAEANLVEALVGGQYTFGDRTFLEGWNLILEYDFQSEGWTAAQWDDFFDQVESAQRFNALAAAGGNPLQSYIQPIVGAFRDTTIGLLGARPAFWGRHYGFVRLSHTDLLVNGLEVAAYAVPSLHDFSFVAGANVSYEPPGGFQLHVDLRYFGGPGRSEFGRSPDRMIAQVEIGYGF